MKNQEYIRTTGVTLEAIVIIPIVDMRKRIIFIVESGMMDFPTFAGVEIVEFEEVMFKLLSPALNLINSTRGCQS